MGDLMKKGLFLYITMNHNKTHWMVDFKTRETKLISYAFIYKNNYTDYFSQKNQLDGKTKRSPFQVIIWRNKNDDLFAR